MHGGDAALVIASVLRSFRWAEYTAMKLNYHENEQEVEIDRRIERGRGDAAAGGVPEGCDAGYRTGRIHNGSSWSGEVLCHGYWSAHLRDRA